MIRLTRQGWSGVQTSLGEGPAWGLMDSRGDKGWQAPCQGETLHHAHAYALLYIQQPHVYMHPAWVTAYGLPIWLFMHCTMQSCAQTTFHWQVWKCGLGTRLYACTILSWTSAHGHPQGGQYSMEVVLQSLSVQQHRSLSVSVHQPGLCD